MLINFSGTLLHYFPIMRKGFLNGDKRFVHPNRCFICAKFGGDKRKR